MKKGVFWVLTVAAVALSVAVFAACSSNYERYDDADRYSTGTSPSSQGQSGGAGSQQGSDSQQGAGDGFGEQSGGELGQGQGAQPGSGTGNSVAVQKVDAVEVDWDSGNVVVAVSESADSVVFYDAISPTSSFRGEITEDLRLHYAVQGRKLIIRYAASGAQREKNLQKDLFLYVPSAKNFNDFEIDVSVGSVSVKNLTAGDLEIDVPSGSVSVENSTVNDVSVHCDANAVSLSNVIANDVSVETRSGSVKIEGVSFNELSVETDSGNVEWTPLKDFGFKLDFETRQGNLHDYFGLVPNGKNLYRFGDGFSEADVETSTGDLTILSETQGGNVNP